MESKEKNFFQKVWTSICNFEKYQEFAGEPLKQSIAYMLIFTLIFTVLVAIPYTYKAYPLMLEKQIITDEPMAVPILALAMCVSLLIVYLINHFVDALVLGILRIYICKIDKTKIKI